MKKYSILLLAISFLGLTGCIPGPNLVVKEATIVWATRTAKITVKNIGNEDAGAHFTYVEINEVGAADAVKPQSQFSANVSGITAGSSWDLSVPFSKFSVPPDRGLDLSTLTTANLVVRADAKNLVKESNEGDNIYDANH